MPREKIMEEQTARDSAARYAACLDKSPGKKSLFRRIKGILS